MLKVSIHFLIAEIVSIAVGNAEICSGGNGGTPAATTPRYHIILILPRSLLNICISRTIQDKQIRLIKGNNRAEIHQVEYS